MQTACYTVSRTACVACSVRVCCVLCAQAVFLLIGKTSALTMNIAGVIKDWMLIFCSYYFFKAPVTLINLLGYVFCCSGVRRLITASNSDGQLACLDIAWHSFACIAAWTLSAA